MNYLPYSWTYRNVEIAHHVIFRADDGKGIVFRFSQLMGYYIRFIEKELQ